jgi:hypothetical protein
MARTKAPAATPIELPVLDGDVLTANQNLMAGNSAEVMARFGDGLPYDRTRLVNETRFYMAQSAEAMLEAGKRLIILKEIEGHGEFLKIIQEQLGLDPRIAQKMAQAAAKFLSPSLLSNAKTFSHLGKSKLYDLMLEDDEELAALAEGGTLVGLTIDEIDRMSCRELRAALRDVREDYKAQGEVLTKRSGDLQKTKDELDVVRKRIHGLPADEVIKQLRTEVVGLQFEIEAKILGELREGFSKMAEHASEQGQDHRTYQADLIRQLEITLAKVRSEFHLPEHQGDAPVWMSQAEA